MIEALASQELYRELSRFVLVLLRAGGLVIFCPIFSSQLIPGRIRVGIAITIAIVLLPMAPASVDAGGQIGVWLLIAARELATGFGLGLAARVLFDGIEGAAHLVAGQSGFALSSMIDPLTGGQSVAPALFQGLLATTLVLAADLHHLFLRGLAHSYALMPPAAAVPGTGLLDESVALLGARMFGIAVELAAPALVVTFAVDLVLVLVGRAMPQMPILIVGYPLKVAAGLVAMAILAFGTGSALGWIGRTFASDGAALIAAFGTR